MFSPERQLLADVFQGDSRILAINEEFAAVLCDFTFTDPYAHCLNLAAICTNHDDAIPQEEAKEKMREYLRNNGYRKGLMVDGEVWPGWYKD